MLYDSHEFQKIGKVGLMKKLIFSRAQKKRQLRENIYHLRALPVQVPVQQGEGGRAEECPRDASNLLH